MKFLEYEISTGRILSQITCESEPSVSNGIGLLSIDDHEEIDSTMYEVRSGSLVKTMETEQEILERERVKREYQEKCRMRYRSIEHEFIFALIKEDINEMNNLRREVARMEAYL